MSKDLISNKFGIVKKSPVHRWGVFATEDIEAGTILEECPVIHIYSVPFKDSTKEFKNYLFSWPTNIDAKQRHPVMVLGWAEIYNHNDNNNVNYYSDNEKDVMVYKTIKKVSKGEELFVNYGQSYFDALKIKKI
ncbi:MAG: SET domain-containing protein-lysine N-methyltransferase [Promethearchaeota archaeon]|jgi:SET domain-containing protein